ncbi:MAG: FkbM family methyltransferase [Methyloceanibacter sp.]
MWWRQSLSWSGTLSEKYRDLSDALPVDFRTVIDVGAHLGNTVAEVLRFQPRATIHAIEPVSLTFAELCRRFAGNQRVHCHNLALGATAGEAIITVRGTNSGNRIVQEKPDGVPVETITTASGDEFAQSVGLERVSFVKIDTEGFDQDVLRGFSRMLAEQRIDAFQVEVSMGPQNTKHVALESIRDYVSPLGYWLFKLYDQAHERKRPIARRADAVFISTDCIRRRKRRRLL